MKQLKNLEKMDIDGNPNLNIIPEITETNNATIIIDYYIKNIFLATLSPKRENIFKELLYSINNYTRDNKLTPPKCFISYAWEVDETKKIVQQEWLTKLKEYLEILSVVVFFDLFDMELNLKATMLNNINDSDFVIIICTPRYKERVKMGSSNNARYELDTIMEKKKEIIPIIYEGDFSESVPDEFKAYLAIDFTKAKDYIKNLVGYKNPKGIISTIFGIKPEQTYENLIDSLLL